MYLQDIVISPDIFEKINKAHDIDSDIDIDFRSYKENLNLKKLVLDSNSGNGDSKLWNQINHILQTANDFGRKKIDSILKTFLESSSKIQFVHIDEIKKYSRKDDLLNLLLNLTNKTESKIINSEDDRLKLVVDQEKDLEQIEILNFEESIKPKSLLKSRIFIYEKKIEIKKNDKFEFEKYFLPYLSNTNLIIINDRYLRIMQRAFKNLCKIISICDAKHVKIYTIIRNSEKDKFDMPFDNFKSELEKNFPNKEIEILDKPEHRRWIKTDKFIIRIDPGLDFVNNNYIADMNKVEIEFSKREDID